MSEIPGLITKVMNYGTTEPVSEMRLVANCLECMGNIIKKVLIERKYQTTKVGVCTEVLGSILWSRLRTMFTNIQLSFFHYCVDLLYIQ